jgi:hypothetical protein
MPTPTDGNGVEVVLTYLQNNGDVCVNVLHYTGSNTVTADDASDINDAFATAWLANLRGVTADNTTWRKLEVKRMDAAPWFTWSFDHAQAGLDGGNLLPAQIAVCASLHTAAAGRSGRGRIYFGSATEAWSTTTGSVEPTIVTALADWIADVSAITAASTNVYVLGVWSRKLNGINNITDVSIDTRFDVQRRRANRRI